jgi:hypothetical protein
MSAGRSVSSYRIQKRRSDAVVTLTSGDRMHGCFFIASGSARHSGPERVGELLNAEPGFFPFEVHEPEGVRTILCNRAHVLAVALAENEAREDAGYGVATRRLVSVLLSNGRRLTGAVLVHRPQGHDRVSDWARQTETFRYLETPDMTIIVNTAHVVEIAEVTEP